MTNRVTKVVSAALVATLAVGCSKKEKNPVVDRSPAPPPVSNAAGRGTPTVTPSGFAVTPTPSTPAPVMQSSKPGGERKVAAQHASGGTTIKPLTPEQTNPKTLNDALQAAVQQDDNSKGK